MKQQEWDERCKPHAQEIEAISDPIKILNSDDALELFKVIAQEEGRVDHVQVHLCVHQGLREGDEAQQGVASREDR